MAETLPAPPDDLAQIGARAAEFACTSRSAATERLPIRLGGFRDIASSLGSAGGQAAKRKTAVTEDELIAAIESTMEAALQQCQRYFLQLAELWLPGVAVARTESYVNSIPTGVAVRKIRPPPCRK
jgi:hypothetical protein